MRFASRHGRIYFCENSTQEINQNVCGPAALSLTGSASHTDLSQLANGIWEIHAGCPSFLRVSSVAKIGYIPQFKSSNARDQDEVSSDLARMGPAVAFRTGWFHRLLPGSRDVSSLSSTSGSHAQNIHWCPCLPALPCPTQRLPTHIPTHSSTQHVPTYLPTFLRTYLPT